VLIVALVVAAAAGGVSGYAWYVSDRVLLARGLRRGWWQALAGLPDGAVARIAGRVDSIDLITSPLRGRGCVAYHTRVLAADRGFRVIGELRGGRPFRVVDDSGVALVDPEGAVVAPGDAVSSSDEERVRELSPRAREVVERACEITALDRFERVVVTEALLVPGRLVAVQGRVLREPVPGLPGRNYREAPPIRVRLVAPDDAPLVVLGQEGKATDTGLTRSTGSHDRRDASR
jgi:hypothetical protein